MKNLVFSACFACALSACAQQSLAPIKEPPVKASVLSTVSKDRLADGTSTVAIRTFRNAASEDGKTKPQEIVGIPCHIESDELRAKVVTPREVTVPNFKQRAKYPNRGLPSALVVTCEQGGLRGVTSVASKEKQVTTAVGGGLAVSLITLATSAAIANSTPWVYHPVASVGMEPR